MSAGFEPGRRRPRVGCSGEDPTAHRTIGYAQFAALIPDRSPVPSARLSTCCASGAAIIGPELDFDVQLVLKAKMFRVPSRR